MKLLPLLLSSALLAASSPSAWTRADPLPTFNVDKSQLTVSGISAGACFATQFHVAHSTIIKGVGMWAGAPNLCYAQQLTNCLLFPSLVLVNDLVRDTNNLAADGDIDPTPNIANAKIYVHHGLEDHVVYPAAAEKVQQYYSSYISNSANIRMETETGASHAVVSDHAGTSCGDSDNRLYIENCGYNSVFDMLDHVLGGGLSPPTDPGTMQGTLMSFEMADFLDGDSPYSVSLDDIGYAYIPPACGVGSTTTCRLHVFFHGCGMQSSNGVGTDFITESGFVQIADANNIVILFPQTIAKALDGNPLGCFNWMGYLEDLFFWEYATKSGAQMKGIYNMLAHAAGL